MRDKLFNAPEEAKTEVIDKQESNGKSDKVGKDLKTEAFKKADENYGAEQLDLGTDFLTDTPTGNYSPGNADE